MARRRDWVLLPAVSLLTLCALAVSVELLSRWLYPVRQVGFQNCFATNDPSGDAAVKPNSVCWEQSPESTARVEYRFNQKGHRAGSELVPKATGTFRIVLLGSSLTQGLFVPREKTFAALLPAELSLKTGRRVEVYNEATGGKYRGGPFPTPNSAQQFDQVLAAQPDLILWVMTPTDIPNAADRKAPAGGPRNAQPPRDFWKRLSDYITNGTLGSGLKAHWEATRTSMVLKHLLIASESQEEYIASYLKDGENASFLRTSSDAQWEAQLRNFEADVDTISRLAADAGVPLVAVLVPNRVQVAMISSGQWPTGFDPYKLDRELRERVERDGGAFVDILPDYRTIPSPERNYFPVDGHPDADGQGTIFRFLAKELTRDAVPELKTPAPRDIAMEPGK